MNTLTLLPLTNEEIRSIYTRIEELAIAVFNKRQGDNWWKKGAVNKKPKNDCDGGYEFTRIVVDEIFTPEMRRRVANVTRLNVAQEGDIVDFTSSYTNKKGIVMPGGIPICAGGVEFRQKNPKRAGIKITNEDRKDKEYGVKKIQITCKFDNPGSDNPDNKGKKKGTPYIPPSPKSSFKITEIKFPVALTEEEQVIQKAKRMGTFIGKTKLTRRAGR